MACLAAEARAQEGVNELARELDADDAAAEHEHVHVVVLHALVRRVGVVAQAGPDAGHLVGRHRRADAAAAHDDAPFGAVSAQGGADGLGEVRVVDRLPAVGADVENLAVLRVQEALDRLLQLEAGVIGSNRHPHGRSARPGPVGDLGTVASVLVRVAQVVDDRVLHVFLEVPGLRAQPRHPIDHVDHQVEARRSVQHRQLQRRVDVPLLAVAVDVQVLLALEAVGELVDQRRVAVEVEDDRLVGGEQAVELAFRRPVRVIRDRMQLEQVDDVDEAQLEIGEPLAQDRRRRERLQRHHIAAARQHDVGLVAVVRARPLPDAHALGDVDDSLVDGRELQVPLLVGDDDVDAVGAAQALVADHQQRVGVGRQVDTRDRRALVGHQVDESRILMGEAVVILPPDGRRQQDVLRRDRRAPPDVILADVQPLRVLVEHRIDHVRERLVGVEQPVPPGQQIPLQPAEQRMLGQHLHHPAVARQLAAVRVLGQEVGHPGLLADLIDRLKSVGGGLVGTEQAEVRRVGLHHVAQHLAERLGVLVQGRAARHHVDGVVAKVGELELLAQHAAVGVRVRADPAVPPG